MGLTPTKTSIIGTFINGRNDQQDFLQLASNNGDSVFAWIDAQGILRGTFASSFTPVGPDQAVQFNNAGSFDGVSALLFNVSSSTLTLSGTGSSSATLTNPTAATSLQNQNSPALTLTGQAWIGSPTPTSQTITFAIQEVNGGLSFSQTAGPAATFPFVFTNNVQTTGINITGLLSLVFDTGGAGASAPLTAAANAVGPLTTYTGTFSSQPKFGQNVTISGFVNGANNGTFVVQSSGPTSLVVYNSSGVAESHAATATTQGDYFDNQGGFGIILGNQGLLFPIEGTNFQNINSIQPYPYAPGLAITVKGDSVDAAYLRIINDGTTGNHGLEIGGIIDGTGANPVTLSIGHFNGGSGAQFNSPLALNGTAQTVGSGYLGLGSTTATSATAGSNGDVPAQVVGYLIFNLAGTTIKVPYYAS